MGDCLSRCFSSFRATFRPNDERPEGHGGNLPLIPHITKPPSPVSPDDYPKPPTEIESGGTDDSVLVVESVDLCVEANAQEHFTQDYDAVQKGKLVIRRGSPFTVKVAFKRPYNAVTDAICLVFTVKDIKKPSYANQTLIIIPIVESDDEAMTTDAWQAKVITKEENKITIEVIPLPTAIVGEWALDVDTKQKKDNEIEAKSLRYTVKTPIYMLFNPWCKQDTVYLSDPEWRKEYVLNESGLIWRGTHSRLRKTIWNYGQFQENVLECCFYLLGHGPDKGVVVPSRSDPIKIVRHISAVVNSPDDDGVLVGNWTGDYAGGSPPTSWNGSVEIMQKFYKTKKPVKFGQCWVFAGVCTTICRALGIPCRSVTNFSSAHDTHNSLTVDYFFDEDGQPVDRLNEDSVWNFHVWNEVWMERPDLEPGGYGGWQAIDATPQEESDGVYRCGPASVVAIKRGEIKKPFDNPFVFAEVNADKVYWRYQGPSQPLKLIKNSTDAIGQFISTKAIGSFDREDITQEYKHEERSKEERETMLRALRQARNNIFSRYYLNEELEDIEFDFLLLDDIIIGSPFTVKLTAKHKNTTGKDKEYNVEAMLRVDSMLYTGRLKHAVKKEKYQAKLTPGQEKEFTLNVSYTDYERAIVDQADFNIAAMAKVVETNFEYFGQDDFRVRMPDIIIETEGDLIKGQEFTGTAYFKNPLPKTLSKAYFVIEGPGLGQPLKLLVKGSIPAGGEPRVSFKLTPKSAGEKVIAAKFYSRELSDVDGYKEIVVKEPPSANDVISNDKPTDGTSS